jgi:hypothetical protein
MEWRLVADYSICNKNKFLDQMNNYQPFQELESYNTVYSYTHYVMQGISERIYLLMWSINSLFS